MPVYFFLVVGIWKEKTDFQGPGDIVTPTTLHRRKHHEMDFLGNEDAGQGGNEQPIPSTLLKWQHTLKNKQKGSSPLRL